MNKVSFILLISLALFITGILMLNESKRMSKQGDELIKLGQDILELKKEYQNGF
jgi:hypothetical protein